MKYPLTYLEVLIDSVLSIIDEEGMDPINRIGVSEEVYKELLSFKSHNYLKQTIGYPIQLEIGMVQPYSIFRKKANR